jgi:glucose-6-phosphate isomerase
VVYEHDISACLAATIGEHGLTPARYRAALAHTAPALARLRAWRADGALPLLALPGRGDDLAVLVPLVAEASRKFSDLVVLATGGSSLGGQALAALKAHPLAPASRNWLHFADTRTTSASSSTASTSSTACSW